MTTTLPRELAVISLTAGPDAVFRYAELTEDFNPIHLDPEFAAGTAFGKPIIHGTLGLNLVIEAIERTFGALPADVEIDARFVRPVPVGSTVRAGGSLCDAATGTYEIYVETQAGERAVEGVCTIGPQA
ncbi:MaoC family dehydratase [Microvirga sp. G4-2]|uniref:MaoC family dehydratase n=1 Tax=Microvirga sp. G4-2 TaxID=3434467 RepID=UPI0040449334